MLMKFMDWKGKMITLSQITRSQGVYKLPAPFCKYKSNICRCICFGWRQIGAVRWEKTGLIGIYWNVSPVMWLNWHVPRYPAEIPAILLTGVFTRNVSLWIFGSLCRITCLATHAKLSTNINKININYIYFLFYLLIIRYRMNPISYP